MELFVLVGVYYSIYHLIDYCHRIAELEVVSTVLAIEKETLDQNEFDLLMNNVIKIRNGEPIYEVLPENNDENNENNDMELREEGEQTNG